MLSNNINIESTIYLKKICNDINSYYNSNKKKLEKDNVTLYNYVVKYINNLDKNYKSVIIDEYSTNCYNKNILYKINNKYDGDPLTIICYDIITTIKI